MVAFTTEEIRWDFEADNFALICCKYGSVFDLDREFWYSPEEAAHKASRVESQTTTLMGVGIPFAMLASWAAFAWKRHFKTSTVRNLPSSLPVKV
ncbi:hypothetical protein AWB78_02432 [Caballeronia calidae]|uniref:Uncharacterized protein n=2 Tax=Caballeronia calidae TaxID=1777139 RepID=A0A158B9C3_9BURK|nr:hypothetical protein AWB78_02432 [Caballeronia calidae]